MSSTEPGRLIDPKRTTSVVAIPLPARKNAGRERSRRAAQKISALGEMTGGIAHDFRNILGVVASGLRIAEDNREDPSRLTSALVAASEGVDRGMRMVSRLLAFARQQEFEAGPEQLNVLLERLEMFLRYGAGPGIRLCLELAPNLPKCVVDPPQFNSAILNLVINARDAMPMGGVVTITTAAVHATADINYVRVEVSDDGSGMSPEVIERIFDPYFTTKGDTGTGLGVPQVQALMRQVGGCVTVGSEVGKGTTFQLFFPVFEERSAGAIDAWRQLDRWADEGGATVDARGPCAA